MKKILLSVALLATTISFAQTLQSENFNSLTIGNVTTDITGATAGQAGFITQSTNGVAPTTSTNSSVANFQIVASGKNTTKGISIAGPNGNLGSRFLWKDGLDAAWALRTSGNNIIEVEVDINPGVRGISRNRFGVSIYNADYTKTLAGFSVNAFTGELLLVAYSTPANSAVGNYNYSIAAAPGVLLPENTWSRVGVSFNLTTGQVLINSNVIVGGSVGVVGSAASIEPTEINFIVSSGSFTGPPAVPNTAAGTMLFDNYIAKAVATSNLLSNTNFTTVENEAVSIYPNPTSDLLNIKIADSNSISAVQIVDLNGRQVLTKSFNNVSDAQVNVNNLSAGMYLINITSGDTVQTKKFLKQ